MKRILSLIILCGFMAVSCGDEMTSDTEHQLEFLGGGSEELAVQGKVSFCGCPAEPGDHVEWDNCPSSTENMCSEFTCFVLPAITIPGSRRRLAGDYGPGEMRDCDTEYVADPRNVPWEL